MKKKKKINLNEFHAWLEGLDDALGSDWVPTDAQWKRIREKISNIIPDVKLTPDTYSQRRTTGGSSRSTHQPTNSNVGASAGQPVLSKSSLSDMNPLITPVDGKTHTPNIDTSDGTYKSPYEN